MTTTLVLGGARSGKTRFALETAQAAVGGLVMVATAEALDAEMAERIARHRAERGLRWRTLEAPLELADALGSVAADETVVVDCLTLWLSNLLHAGRDVAEAATALEGALAGRQVLLVANEVGLGLVPDTPLGRRFRDEAGWLNQRMAKVCDRVVFVAAGLPLVLKDGSMTTTDERHNAKMAIRKRAHDAIVAGKTIEKGLLIVHTGKGKGKTSAALGMVVRAIGHGMKVGVVQFVKGAWRTGETAVFARFPELVEFKAMGEGFTWDTQDRARDIATAERAFEEVKRMIADPSYRMVVADELNIVLRYDYLPLDSVLAAIAARDPMKHVIVTGRNAPQALIDAADLVTEMEAVKHPFRAGVKAQAGIEY